MEWGNGKIIEGGHMKVSVLPAMLLQNMEILNYFMATSLIIITAGFALL